MQRIIIKNFGPIPNCCIDLKDFMIFIGEQATGKSTICKSIYYCKSIRDEIKAHIHEIINKGVNSDKRFPSAINSSLKQKFIDLFGFTKPKDHFDIRFEYGEDVSLEIFLTQDENKYLNIEFSEKIIEKVRELEEQAHYNYLSLRNISLQNELYLQLERNKYFLVFDKAVNELFNDDREIFYIPAGRGLLSLLTNQLLNIEIKNMDYITGDFMKLMQRCRSSFDVALSSLIENDALINKSRYRTKRGKLAEKVRDILRGEYFFKDGVEYIKLKNNKKIPINFTSSGQQEMLWILNLLFLWMLQNRKVFVVIEEPEAHLFPNTQKELVEYIALFANSNENQVIITTHSPYILTAANNLLYAGRIGNVDKNVGNIIPEEKWLKLSSFGAYMIGESENNYVKSIIDEELKEIASEEIDRISNVISSEYAQIFALEDNYADKE